MADEVSHTETTQPDGMEQLPHSAAEPTDAAAQEQEESRPYESVRPVARESRMERLPQVDTPAPEPPVRSGEPVARRSLGLVDNLAEDDLEASIEYVHDSDYATGSFAPLAEQGYRSSRSEIGRVNEDWQYGQYLSVPKGRRTIFARNKHDSRLKVLVFVLVGIVALVVLAIVLWELIGNVMEAQTPIVP